MYNSYYAYRKASQRARSANIDVVYLNIEDDPLTTITVQWHTIGKLNPNSKVLYREEGSEGDWLLAEGDSHDPPATNKTRKIHFCKISGLTPNTGYEFRLFEDATFTFYKFRTFPESLTDRNIKVAFASDSHGFQNGLGDVPEEGNYWWFEELTSRIGKDGFDADLLVGVGDYTYDEGRGRQQDTNVWVLLLKELQKYLINSDGYMIPFLPAIGNHDVLDSSGVDGEKDAFRIPEDMAHYESLFAFPTKENLPVQNLCLGNMKFGNYFHLLLLDTGTNEFGVDDTPQLDFLDAALLGDNAKWTIPAYHRPMYSAREGSQSVRGGVIEMFQERFQNAGVKVEFHGHMHSYVKSENILDNQVIEIGGIVYCGAGTWAENRFLGEGFSQQDIDDMEFIADVKGPELDPDNAKQIWGVILTDNDLTLQAMNYKGNIFFERVINH